MSRTGRRLARRALSGLGVAALGLVLLELVLRLSSLWPMSTPVFVSDEEIGYRVRPGLEIAGGVTNSAGFNDGEPSDGRSSTERWVFLGDSFVFGVVDRKMNFVERFRQLVGGGVEVLNLGIPAAGPHAYLELLRRDAVELDADVACLVLFVGNDVAQAHPDFRTRVWFGAPREVLRKPYLFRLSWEYVYSARLLRAGWRSLRERSRPADDPGTFSRRAFLAIEEQRAEVCKVDLPQLMEESYRGLRVLLEEMVGESRSRGLRLVAILAPDQFQVDAGLREELASERGLRPGDYDLEKPQRRVGEMLSGLGVPTVDLLPVFRGRGAELYLPRDSHWNVAGNDLAAREIYRFYQGFSSPGAL